MGCINNEEKRYFLISISKGRLDSSAPYTKVIDYWYRKPNYKDVYEAVTRIAFTTLARTVRGIQRNPNHDLMKDEASAYLVNRLKGLSAKSQSEFDAWHRKTSENLIAIFAKYNQDFTFGQAQKWINMALKHLALADSSIVKHYYAFCHIPIDSYIIKGLKTNLVSKEMNQIDASFGQDPKKIATWSRIDNYDLYLKFQNDFRNNCSEIPLDYEFHLWQRQKDSL
ncbi:hypothetical protein IKT18_00050 [Candidatus Saccharibacteria bacterium]|nr:hypothetical protein [Candidatus Saccharibacteria bacterium]